MIELTEHELFSAEASLDREIARLRARGARIALDDAGNGYAGLQQIIRIAPDILKLDRSLVDGIHDDPHRFALLEALISFASTTRAAICAEGVEALEDLDVLAGLDVTYAQGWALARPDAPWRALAPGAAAAASAELRLGLRVARETSEERAPTLGDVIALLAGVSCVDDIRAVAEMIPAVLGGDDAAVSRVVPGADCVEDISRHGWSQPGQRYSLADYPVDRVRPAHAHGGAGVTGDPASDPAEVAVLEQAGFQAVLLVPLVFGGRDVGLLELYRRHAIPWSTREIERAQLLAHQLGAVLDLLGAHRLSRATLVAAMAILVDELREYPDVALPFTTWCHMATDGELEELHAFAARLGLRRRWFQRDHYDLPPHGRRAAVALGAEEVATGELLRRMTGPRGDRARRRALAPDGVAWLRGGDGPGGAALPGRRAGGDRRPAGGGEVDARRAHGRRRARAGARPRRAARRPRPARGARRLAARPGRRARGRRRGGGHDRAARGAPARAGPDRRRGRRARPSRPARRRRRDLPAGRAAQGAARIPAGVFEHLLAEWAAYRRALEDLDDPAPFASITVLDRVAAERLRRIAISPSDRG